MGLTRNARVIFNAVPTGYPVPGETTVYDASKTIDVDNVPLNGGFLLKTLVLSIDPHLRGQMSAPEPKSYSVAFTLGEPLFSHGVGVVIRSENPSVKVGDHIYGLIAHQEYNIVKDLEHPQYNVLTDTPSHPLQLINNEHGLPWSVFLGAAGMPGKTAFMAWKEFSNAKKGDIVFVTTGAGTVGSLVIQLAKLEGLKVIASAGSDKKVEYMKSIGADVAFNYKTTDTSEVLEREGPIDVYWDNVGGEILDAALLGANIGARFIECGMTAGYNTGGQPIKNIMLVIGKSITIHGFIIDRLEAKHVKEFYATIPPLLANGKLKYSEDVTEGLEKVGDAILDVQMGRNTAKAIVRVAD